MIAPLVLLVVAHLPNADAAPDKFSYARDTFAFANATVFKYYRGIAFLRSPSESDRKLYTRRCFVMTRGAVQFYKFARFDPNGQPLDDRELARRIRAVSRRAPWHAPLPDSQRVVFPGYANLNDMSKARTKVVQRNIGLGWPTYMRLGNFRMLFQHDPRYQEKTHTNLNAALDRGDLFIGYLSTFPSLAINHSILVYARKPERPDHDVEQHYLAYDPNHPDGPRVLTWSARNRAFAYQKDSDFIGGFVRVYQIYGKLLQ
ncbi:MAG TPA: hypothetical protein VFO30_04190 [Chthoniobacterales bacterium]|nr:hypothetical protein [Chthoniobacterales bacterium]